MNSVKEKFLLTLAISDEGLEMMLQRVRRLNPNANEKELVKILREELRVMKEKTLPKNLKPMY